MQRDLILTKDGSHTIAIPALHVTYHSIHGAIRESLHVFIEAGLKHIRQTLPDQPLHILEMGFGAGLNALLTLIEAEEMQQPVYYTALELYPLSITQVEFLNYCEQLSRPDLQPVFKQLHTCEWEKQVPVTPNLNLYKTGTSLLNLKLLNLKPLNLLYFDAFAPAAQPELWTPEVFTNLYGLLTPDGILVTYCSKGDVRRAMQAAGFIIEKIPGPPGKREMVRAIKPG